MLFLYMHTSVDGWERFLLVGGLCVCVYECVYGCMLYIYIIYIWMDVCMDLWMCVCECVYIYIYMDGCVYGLMDVCE